MHFFYEFTVLLEHSYFQFLTILKRYIGTGSEKTRVHYGN